MRDFNYGTINFVLTTGELRLAKICMVKVAVSTCNCSFVGWRKFFTKMSLSALAMSKMINLIYHLTEIAKNYTTLLMKLMEKYFLD